MTIRRCRSEVSKNFNELSNSGSCCSSVGIATRARRLGLPNQSIRWAVGGDALERVAGKPVGLGEWSAGPWQLPHAPSLSTLSP